MTLIAGSTTFVKGIGTSHPSLSLPLSSALSIPHSLFDLMSVSKLTTKLNRSISFFSWFSRNSGFEDPEDNWRSELNGLYYFDGPSTIPVLALLLPLLTRYMLTYVTHPWPT